ncbi:uncharacterized protein [Chelonus insularis]|uniref:uncharacterized protein n=1 Tax=Chelonus insularis TaxID=460826 RepID=UPI00158D15EB|nr:uncharacterized protein LOC118073423 [Chelonus insularis]
MRFEIVTEKNNCNKLINLSTPWAENYGYPFHLSIKCYDSVLVKDIGITCDLWKLEEEKINREDSEEKLIIPEQKKSNSLITQKLNAYTRNFFDIISMKITKILNQSEQVENDDRLNKIVVATEYIDSEGRPCLRLRLKCIRKQSEESIKTSITPKKNKTETQNRSKSKLKIFFLEIQTNNKRKSSLSSIPSLLNNLTKSKHLKKEIKITHESINENNFNSYDDNETKLPRNRIIATSNYRKQVEILHSSYSPR